MKKQKMNLEFSALKLRKFKCHLTLYEVHNFNFCEELFTY